MSERSFGELIDRYLAELNCSAKELAIASGVSAAAISRYRTGERIPDPDGKQLRLLAHGISSLSGGKYSEQQVADSLSTSVSGLSVDYETFLSNLNALLEAAMASNVELAHSLSFDPSFISRILTGQRRPADLHAFIAGTSRFAARKSERRDVEAAFRALLADKWPAGRDEDDRKRAIEDWLATNFKPLGNPVGSFLEKLDSFDLEDFIRALKFNELKVPTAPVQLPTTKTYSGIREMMECEIDFLKAAVLSKSSADVIMFSDMPIEEMAAEVEFPKKWMFGMALLLRKGLRLKMIHSTGRPFPEMMIGLESFIPMYMTGLISPYYLDNMQNDVFRHILKVAGTVAMQGEAIEGHQSEGRYILTKNRDEVRYFRRRAERLLEHAQPLMRIITSENRGQLSDFLDGCAGDMDARRMILSTLPIGSVPEPLLDKILADNGVDEGLCGEIRSFASKSRRILEENLRNCAVTIEVPKIAREEFEEHPLVLDLSGAFIEQPIAYGYEDYIENLERLKGMVEAAGEGCSLVEDEEFPFRNVQIVVCEERHALISKGKGPIIHFVVEHPAMVAAFSRFTAPMRG